ncbi:MAG: hypothetical protein R3D55_11185 [Chloroflexota bacterium]
MTTPVADPASVEPEILENTEGATAVPQANFSRIDLPNDLRPRGVSDQWYVASEMAESTLYLIEIETGRRFVISEKGGWGNVVVTQATVAWVDDDGHVQQYNIFTGETQQITREPADRFNLAGNDQWLVWQDKRNETGDENYYAADIYAFDLTAGVEIPIAVADGVQQQPALSGDTVVWADNRNSPVRGEPLEGCGNCPDNPFDIYSFNLRTGETAVFIADGKHNAQPTISGNQVAWITFGEGIKLLDLTTGVVETAVPVAESMGYYLANPRLEGNQLSYVISQACDVIVVDETGQEIPTSMGAFLFDLATQETIQLTSYKEPVVLHRGTNLLIAEGCMTGFNTVYLLQDLHPASAVSAVQGPVVVSYDPDLQVMAWEYTIPEFPPTLENARVLDELHYEIRLAETGDGFTLTWSNYPCSTQPVLFIQPGHQLELWPGNIIGEDCESMSVSHIFSVSLDQNVPLADWQFIFHALPDEQ